MTTDTNLGGDASTSSDAQSAPATQVVDANQHASTAEVPQGDKVADTAAAPEKVVPEAYTFVDADGKPMDGEALVEFAAMAKDLKLTQEEAQKVASLGPKMAQAFATQQAQAVEALSAQWTADAQADKEIGGDKLTENLTVAKTALAELGTPALSKLLDESKLGNHPEVIRLLAKVGRAISPDSKFVSGGRLTTAESAAQRMFPNMNP